MVHTAVYSNHLKKLQLTYHKCKRVFASKNVCLTYDPSDQKNSSTEKKQSAKR